ncbi:PfkB family carbohydrate kinase [Frigidibacter sp. MR17.14]|uniref:PfkB family carbohydrate kinase n=1 Tax=Frigidibacter sp. MR17.14 TaxID=3126509 RepID=UPI003012CE14
MPPEPAPSAPILCIGALNRDLIARHDGPLPAGADRPGRIEARAGGVAFNVARALAREGLAVALLAALGSDAEGAALATEAAAEGIDTAGLIRMPGRASDRYLAIEAGGRLHAAIADTATLEAAGPRILAAVGAWPAGPAALTVIDGNLPVPVLEALARAPRLGAVALVSAGDGKAARLAGFFHRPATRFHLNRTEAEALLARPLADAATAARALRDAGAHEALVTDGAATLAWAAPEGTLRRDPPPARARQATGAGDRLLASLIAALYRGADRAAALDAALAAARAHVEGETA